MLLICLTYLGVWFVLFGVFAIVTALPVYGYKRLLQGMTHDGAVADMKTMFRSHFSRGKRVALWLPRQLMSFIDSIPIIGPIVIYFVLLVTNVHFIVRYCWYARRLDMMQSGIIEV